MFDQLVESPYRLADVANPCTEHFYPEWSSRGMRAVRCTRPAKGEALIRQSVFVDAPVWEPKCGIHLKRYVETRPLGAV